MKRAQREGARFRTVFLACVILSVIAAFVSETHRPLSQVAVGIAADMQCIGDYDPTYPYPKVNPKTKKQGLIGKPCQDVTNGHITNGTCQALGKCKAEEVGGEKPQLPELPKPEPKPPQPTPPTQPNCATPATSDVPRDPSCPPATASSSSFLSDWFFGTADTPFGTSSEDGSAETESTAAKGVSAWTRLLESMGIRTTEPDEAAGESSSGSNAAPGVVPFSEATSGGVSSQKPTDGSDAREAPFTTDLSFTNRASTFSQSDGAEVPQSSVLASMASTLRGMLDTIRRWIY
jgi:hypothetical protein